MRMRAEGVFWDPDVASGLLAAAHFHFMTSLSARWTKRGRTLHGQRKERGQKTNKT